MTLKQITEEIIKEFNERFGYYLLPAKNNTDPAALAKANVFLEQSLSRVAHKTIEAIKMRHVDDKRFKTRYRQEWDKGFNTAIKEIEDKSKRFLEA